MSNTNRKFIIVLKIIVTVNAQISPRGLIGYSKILPGGLFEGERGLFEGGGLLATIRFYKGA